MSERMTEHTTFVIDHTYDATPERVFEAWADPAVKAGWFGAGNDGSHRLDFRVGGREVSRGRIPAGPVHVFEAHIYDIVPRERITYAFDVVSDEMRVSVSLTTVEFEPSDQGTRLIYIEQAVFLDGSSVNGGREQEVRGLLSRLGTVLKDEPHE
jgi:uncharacterized protein YndB with AHSA1/START domain